MAESEQEFELDEEGGKRSFKKLIIIVAVVLLLSAGGIAAYFFLMSDVPNDTIDEEQVSVKNETYFYMADPLIVDFPSGSIAKLVQVSLSLLVEDDGTPDILTKHEPMIRNNLLMLIGSQDVNGFASREGKEQLRNAIKQEVIKVMEKMEEKAQIKEVFFTAFVMQ